MGNSNSSSTASAVSAPRTPKNSSSGPASGSVRRSSTVRVGSNVAKSPASRIMVKTSVTSQISLNINCSVMPNGNISPTEDSNFNVKASRSMYELHDKSPSPPNTSLVSHNGSLKRSSTVNSTNTSIITNGSSIEGTENDATFYLMTSQFSQPSMSAPSTIGRTRSIRRYDPLHPVLPTAREICRSCFENPHNDFGNRVLSRVYEKRQDFQKFVNTVGKEKWPLLTNNFQNFIEEIVSQIENVDKIRNFSKRYGEEHVPLKVYGFKPDFWVSVADAILVESAILDMANHQPTEVVTAWSSLVAFIFSNIRDGYYSGLRLHRMSTRKKSFRRQSSITVCSSDNPVPLIATTTDSTEFNGNSMTSSFTDSNRLSPNNTRRHFFFQKSESQNSFSGRADRRIFE